MNELFIDLQRKPVVSNLRKVIGIIYILLGILWAITRILSGEPLIHKTTLSFLDFIYVVVLGISGAGFIIDGSGISMSSWFGKAYISIDSKQLIIKKKVLSKEWVLLWNEIDKLEFTPIRIEFNLTDKTSRNLNYDNMQFIHIQQVKQAIKSIAEEKKIKILFRS